MTDHSSIIIVERWKQPKYPPADSWINKIWYLHTVECYLDIKKNEMLIHANTWVNLKNVMLSKRSQSRKITYWMTLFTWNAQNRKIYGGRKLIRDCSGLRVGRMREWGGWQTKSTRFLPHPGVDETIIKLTVVIVALICEYDKNYWIVIFKWVIIWFVWLNYISRKLFYKTQEMIKWEHKS